MSKINSTSYEKLHSSSRDKFSPQQFPKLKGLAANTISTTNSIFNIELNSLSSLYKSLVNEIETLEKEINKTILINNDIIVIRYFFLFLLIKIALIHITLTPLKY